MRGPEDFERRRFLARLSGVAGATWLGGPLGSISGWVSAGGVSASGAIPRVAFLGTEVRTHSHAQHFLDRMTFGYGWSGYWQPPRVEVASVYIDQIPEGDLSAERIALHQLQQFDSVEAALTLGGDSLAVDGVVIIGEHGRYPKTARGQTRYPRYEWFKKIVRVFESSGRSVPVFNDKHLSTEWPECLEMIEDARRLGFPFLAGSSLPVTRRLPAVDLPYGARLRESVCVAYGGVDSYDIHALETAQCMSERRDGGELGVRSVQALRGDRLWERLGAAEHEQTRRLIVSALTRSHTLPVSGGFPSAAVDFEWFRGALPDTLGYFVEHVDGLKTTMLLTGIADFNYAGLLEDGQTLSCQMYLPMPTRGATTADFFTPLVRHIEDMVLTGEAPYPAERTLLTSGVVIAAIDSLAADSRPIATPHLEFAYRAPEKSLFWID